MFTRRQLITSTLAAPLLAARTKPNIVFVFSDDHHFQALGAAGNPNIHTPNLDRLANQGVHFTNGLISTPQCAPSRGVMLTGRETYQTGLISNGQTSFQKDVSPTPVQQLRDSGYDTIHIGKWHIEPPPGQLGFRRSPLWLAGGASVYRDPKLRCGQDGKTETVPGHITDLFTDSAIATTRDSKNPFFLWLAYNAPHTPWYAAGKYRAPYAGKTSEQLAPPFHPKGGQPFDWLTYYSVITHLDEAVGRFVDALKSQGHWNNTVLFFIGDNGFMAGTRNWVGKVRHWEESIRVPYFVTGGAVKARARVDDPVASVDAVATWLDLAGIKPAHPLAGRSLRSYLNRGKGNIDVAYSVWDDPRVEGLAAKVAVEPYRVARGPRYKLTVFASGRQTLCDIQTDPAEQTDLIADDNLRPIRESLRRKLRARMQLTGDHAIAWLR